MFPYIEHPSITVGPYTIYAFAVLMILAGAVGLAMCVARAPRYGLDRFDMITLAGWTLGWGFVGAHVFAVLAYYPGRIWTDPFVLFRIFGSLSSFGGIFGGMLAAILVMQRRGLSGAQRLACLDCMGFALPFAWIFGRAGCAFAHDHLGIASDSWLAVRFPGGSRLDLGLLEFFFTCLIATLFLALDRKPRTNGFFLALFFTVYGPGRFALDAFRTRDVRYLDATPGQFLALASTLLGVWLLLRVHRRSTTLPG